MTNADLLYTESVHTSSGLGELQALTPKEEYALKNRSPGWQLMVRDGKLTLYLDHRMGEMVLAIAILIDELVVQDPDGKILNNDDWYLGEGDLDHYAPLTYPENLGTEGAVG